MAMPFVTVERSSSVPATEDTTTFAASSQVRTTRYVVAGFVFSAADIDDNSTTACVGMVSSNHGEDTHDDPQNPTCPGTPKNIAWLPRHSSADPVDANQLRPNTVTYDWVLRRTTKSSPAARCHGSLGRSPSLSLRIGTQSSRPHMPQAQRATQPLHRQNGWTSSYGHVYSPSTRAEKGQPTQWWLAPNRACSALVEQG